MLLHVALHREGYSTRKIASKIKISQIAVMNALKRKQQTESNRSRHPSDVGSHHRMKTSSSAYKVSVRTRTAPEFEELNSTRQRPVLLTAVKCCLRDYGLKRCIAAKKL